MQQKLLKSLQNGDLTSSMTYTEYKIDVNIRKGVINP